MLQSGLKSLSEYSPSTFQWTQAHSEGRFCIVRAILMWSKGAARLDVNGDSIKIIVDENRLDDIHDAAGILLKHLNYYKATCKPDEAFQFYHALTGLDDKWLSIRTKIIEKRRASEKSILYAHAILKYDENSKEYSMVSPFASCETPKISEVIHSYLDNIEISQIIPENQ